MSNKSGLTLIMGLLLLMPLAFALDVNIGCPEIIEFTDQGLIECIVDNPDSQGITQAVLTVDNVVGADFKSIGLVPLVTDAYPSNNMKSGYVGPALTEDDIFLITLNMTSAGTVSINFGNSAFKTSDSVLNTDLNYLNNVISVTPSCESSCNGKTCGDDGCGGSCGTCGEGYSCTGGNCLVECLDIDPASCVAGWDCDTNSVIDELGCSDGYGCDTNHHCVELDIDGDGYIEDDCDPTNSDIHPDALEVCGDAVDNNCDGEVDEGCGVTVSNHFQGLVEHIASTFSASDHQIDGYHYSSNTMVRLTHVVKAFRNYHTLVEECGFDDCVTTTLDLSTLDDPEGMEVFFLALKDILEPDTSEGDLGYSDNYLDSTIAIINLLRTYQ